MWEISRIKGTPAAILGRIKAPDAESAVKEWIEKIQHHRPRAAEPVGGAAREMTTPQSKIEIFGRGGRMEAIS